MQPLIFASMEHETFLIGNIRVASQKTQIVPHHYHSISNYTGCGHQIHCIYFIYADSYKHKKGTTLNQISSDPTYDSVNNFRTKY
jgi:hypothetical protein